MLGDVFRRKEIMKKRSTYRLLVQSEEKSRNILETGLYALFAISAVVSIWQFAEQTTSLPLHRSGAATEQLADGRIAS
jgi:hypothetical protein